MTPEIEAMYEANKNLNYKIDELEKNLDEYRVFKRMWERDQEALKAMEENLHRKYNTVRVVYTKDNVQYVCQILSLKDTSGGLFIEIGRETTKETK